MKGSDIRRSFLDFFAERGHRRYPSAPLVPQSDPTLLFTNAGMVPFKAFFLGAEEPPSRRAVSVQKSLRVSGKHNDLENVGPSPRHHTFFEMLGNFSFGDYFKAEAIEFAWELVTKVWGLDPAVLYATIYREDDEAFGLWRGIAGLPEDRIVRCGKKDNFWSMGETGPCGPCSEIHIDLDPASPRVPWDQGSESGRYFEFWNLVFMQFDARPGGELVPLPNPSIDTGAGLERVAAVLQRVGSNYDTDLFQPLLQAAAEVAGKRYGEVPGDDLSMRVVADHLRAVGFLLADGVVPGNEGRGYVLRRILRRAVRHGLRLGLEQPFLHSLLAVLARTMPEYPELEATRAASTATVEAEEEKFLTTVAAASRHVQELIETARAERRHRLGGEEVFRLYDTFGLPVELVREILEEEGFDFDEEGFRRELELQRERSRSATKGAQGQAASLRAALGATELPPTRFQGYDQLELEGARVLALAREQADGGFVAASVLRAGDRGVLVLDATVFYAESGGQVGDQGTLLGTGSRLAVADTQKDGSGVYLHQVEVLAGEVGVGTELRLQVDQVRRRRTERNHTATHLLHASLRERLGLQVRQAGSLVHPDRLRFDFTFDRPLTEEEREAIEDSVQDGVLRAVATQIQERPYADAIALGAMALFGEKYGDRVRTVEVPGVSLELCGGCHVRNTGEIGSFRIVSERGIASGVRRIEALSGDAAERLAREEHHLLRAIEQELQTPAARAADEIRVLKERLRHTEKDLERERLRRLEGGADDGAHETTVEGIRVVIREVAPAPAGQLRSMADLLRQRLGSGVVVLGAREDDKVSVVVTVTPDLVARLDAGRLARRLGALVGGNGGGRSDFAQAGGKDPARLAGALQAVPEAVRAEVLGVAGGAERAG